MKLAHELNPCEKRLQHISVDFGIDLWNFIRWTTYIYGWNGTVALIMKMSKGIKFRKVYYLLVLIYSVLHTTVHIWIDFSNSIRLMTYIYGWNGNVTMMLKTPKGIKFRHFNFFGF
jgi:hypothetical protein